MRLGGGRVYCARGRSVVTLSADLRPVAEAALDADATALHYSAAGALLVGAADGRVLRLRGGAAAPVARLSAAVADVQDGPAGRVLAADARGMAAALAPSDH